MTLAHPIPKRPLPCKDCGAAVMLMTPAQAALYDSDPERYAARCFVCTSRGRFGPADVG